MDPSPFLNLQQMLVAVEPYERLWKTVWQFHENYDLWYYGPFQELDAELVKEEVDNMWRTFYKLAKTFGDNPGARRIADMVRSKVEKFRQFLPVLSTICNKGLQPRHWQAVSAQKGLFFYGKQK